MMKSIRLLLVIFSIIWIGAALILAQAQQGTTTPQGEQEHGTMQRDEPATQGDAGSANRRDGNARDATNGNRSERARDLW